MRLPLALAAACVLMSASAFAQSPSNPSASKSAVGSISAGDLVNKVIMTDMFDQQLAQLALQNGNSSDKTFAQQDTPVHAKATNDLKMLVMNGKLNATLPTALDSEQQQKLQSIQKLSGRQFEVAFRTYESQNHAEEIAYAERYAKTGDNADLKNWVNANLPLLKDQLNKAEGLS